MYLPLRRGWVPGGGWGLQFGPLGLAPALCVGVLPWLPGHLGGGHSPVWDAESLRLNPAKFLCPGSALFNSVCAGNTGEIEAKLHLQEQRWCWKSVLGWKQVSFGVYTDPRAHPAVFIDNLDHTGRKGLCPVLPDSSLICLSNILLILLEIHKLMMQSSLYLEDSTDTESGTASPQRHSWS